MEGLIETSVNNIKKVTKNWTNDELKKLIKLENQVKPYRGRVRKTLINYLEKRFNPECKKNNAKREDKELDYLVDCINEKNKTGLKLINDFHKNFGKKIIVAKKAGGRGNRYDFEIMFENDPVWYKIEHKGCKNYKKIEDKDKPWEDSVQFLNGNPKSFAICEKYAKLWHKIFIQSGELSKNYNLKTKIPDFCTWKSDAFRQGKEQTEFVKELVKESTKKNKSKSLFKERKLLNDSFVLTPSDIKKLQKEIQEQYQLSMKSKDYWIKINGDIRNTFDFKWYKTPDNLPKITKVEQIKDKRDIMSLCSCDNNTSFIAHMRWGKGQGITNLRLDFK